MLWQLSANRHYNRSIQVELKKEIMTMSPKPIHKKLVLKKETIANLGKKGMLNLRAGAYAPESENPGETTCANSHCPILTCTCKCDTVPGLQ
jgi:hypothetical protein